MVLRFLSIPLLRSLILGYHLHLKYNLHFHRPNILLRPCNIPALPLTFMSCHWKPGSFFSCQGGREVNFCSLFLLSSKYPLIYFAFSVAIFCLSYFGSSLGFLFLTFIWISVIDLEFQHPWI